MVETQTSPGRQKLSSDQGLLMAASAAVQKHFAPETRKVGVFPGAKNLLRYFSESRTNREQASEKYEAADTTGDIYKPIREATKALRDTIENNDTLNADQKKTIKKIVEDRMNEWGNDREFQGNGIERATVGNLAADVKKDLSEILKILPSPKNSKQNLKLLDTIVNGELEIAVAAVGVHWCSIQNPK